MILAFFTFVVLQILVIKGKLSRGEELLPLYISFLHTLVTTALPILLAMILLLHYNMSYLSLILVAITILSQYYVIKYRIEIIRKRYMPKVDVVVDG